MKQQLVPSLLAVAAFLALVSAPAAGQSPPLAAGRGKAFVPGRTPDGQPDLSGIWVNFDSTPFETEGKPAFDDVKIGFNPPAAALHVVERFTPVDASTIDYEVTITDPNVYTTPWRVRMPLTRDAGYQMYEYACAEGNYATPNMLAAGRAEEQER